MSGASRRQLCIRNAKPETLNKDKIQNLNDSNV